MTSDLILGLLVFVMFMSVMCLAWLFDFIDAHDIHLRPYWEEKIKEATDDQDDC